MNRIIVQIIAVCFLTMMTRSQASEIPQTNSTLNFGTDVVAHYDPELGDLNSDVAVAFNGWIYVAFSTDHMSPPGTDINMVISKDSGLTWQSFPAAIGGSHNGAAVYDLIVAGKDTNSLRVYLSYYEFSVAFPYPYGGVKVFDGLTGADLPYSRTFGDGTYGIGQIHLASDWENPAFGSNGYSVAIVYSTQSGDSTSTDSLICLVASDTAINNYNYYLLDSSSSENIYNASIGYGHSLAWSNGRYFISYMKALEINFCRNTTSINSGFTIPISINPIAGIPVGGAGYLKIVCQNSYTDNDSSGLSVMIMAKALDSTGTSTYKIPWVIYNMQAALTDYWFSESVFPTVNDMSLGTFDASYSSVQDRFYLTGYNTDSAKLFTSIEDFNFSSGGSWFSVSDQYNDSVIDPATEPNPAITCSGDFAYTTWTMNTLGNFGRPIAQIMFDRQELPLITTTNEIKTFSEYSIYPNPANDKITIQNISGNKSVRISLFDINGRKVFDSNKTDSRIATIVTTDFVDGVYFVTISDEHNRLTHQKIIIVH